MKNEEKDKNRKWLIIVLLFCMAICIGITVWAVFFRGGGDPVTNPDYPPAGIEINQNPISGDTDSKLDTPEGGGAINVTYRTEAKASLSDKTITFYYANPGASTQNVSVLIKVEDLLIAKSDLITPGHEITKLTLEDKAVELLKANNMYKAELVIRAYDPDSNEKAMVETKGEITLTVTE